MTDLAQLAHEARDRIERIARADDLVARFTVQGRPIPKGSMRTFTDGTRSWATHDNKGLSQWTHDIFWSAKAALGRRSLVTGPVECVLDFVIPVPKSRAGELWPIQHQTGDLDKLTRATLDGLTASLWKDDSQVVRLSASKRYENTSLMRHPGVTIAVFEIPI